MTRRGAAVLGLPIAHSLSPALHRAAYDALGLDDWTYRAVECDEPALAGTLRALEAEGLSGVSLTMPLKRAVLPLLSRVERLAADVGAVNTVLFGGVAGEWWGANTDVPGMVAALRAAGLTLGRRDVPVVLGAGATAASALAALAELGAPEAVVVARRAGAVEELLPLSARFGLQLHARDWHDPAPLDGPLVVSTAPAGAADELAAALAAGSRRVRGLLFDVVYAPWPTRLAQAWQAGGGDVVGGLELLVEQAAVQVRLMTGHAAPLDAMRAAGQAALRA